jgi:hypothetical protein
LRKFNFSDRHCAVTADCSAFAGTAECATYRFDSEMPRL